MIDSYFGTELTDGWNIESRAHTKAVLRLTIASQQKRTADFGMAASMFYPIWRLIQ